MTSTAAPPVTGTERWIGQPLDRRDGPAKTTGTARYSAEYPFDDLAHAALVCAPGTAWCATRCVGAKVRR